MRRLGSGVLLAALVVTGACGGDEEKTGIAEARSVIRDADRFGDSLNAAQAYLDASEAMLEDAQVCAEEKGKEDPACVARFSYGAWLQAQSVTFTQCTLPGILESRQLVEADLDKFLDGENPGLPPAADC